MARAKRVSIPENDRGKQGGGIKKFYRLSPEVSARLDAKRQALDLTWSAFFEVLLDAHEKNDPAR